MLSKNLREEIDAPLTLARAARSRLATANDAPPADLQPGVTRVAVAMRGTEEPCAALEMIGTRLGLRAAG
jgi:hypothetical protein